ncbi:MAG TPA: hypothetical protein VES19_14735 [Candidatus Limnocylindrales bacterium]|nr:hypothetical protein [Candidatus Limnocylindrales bacterium]
MIEPEAASRWRSQAAYDRIAAILIGVIAILAAVFAVQQAHEGLAGTRAQVESARLAADAAARIGASSTADAAGLRAQQDALLAGISGTSRQIEALSAGDEAASAVGAAHAAAAERLAAAVGETLATTGSEPVDGYTAGLINATTEELMAIVSEQNRQVDLAIEAGGHQLVAILGLSLVALAGVLAGIAAVLGRGKAGWLLLAIAWAVTAGAAVPAVQWLF